MQSYYVGLDVHSRESVFVVENAAGAIDARGSVPTTVNGLKHLRDSCGLPATTGVALETGTSAFFVARELAISSPNNSRSMCAITMPYGAKPPSGSARSTAVSATAHASGAMR